MFPGSERLRYLIPFRDAHETIDYLRRVAEEHRMLLVTIKRTTDGFGWGSRPGEVVN